MLWILAGVIAIIFLIGCSAFFSGSEMAFVSVSRASIRDKANRGNKHAQTLEKLLETPDDVVSAIVVGNNIVNIFASVIAGSIATAVFGDIGIGIATTIMTLLIVIFSEVTPKAFGINNEKMVLRISRALRIITRIFYPVSVFLTAISNRIIALTPGREKRSTAVTEEEIRAMLELGAEEGTIKGDEKEMVNEILDFDDTIAWEVHVPRDDIIFLHESDSIAELVKTSIETGYSRFPVYRDTIDDIIGLVGREVVRLVGLGVGLGLFVGVLSSRALETMLFGISATDPVTFVGVPLLIALIATVSALAPARRASRIDPAVALRQD